jgi:hypothetical protein
LLYGSAAAPTCCCLYGRCCCYWCCCCRCCESTGTGRSPHLACTSATVTVVLVRMLAAATASSSPCNSRRPGSSVGPNSCRGRRCMPSLFRTHRLQEGNIRATVRYHNRNWGMHLRVRALPGWQAGQEDPTHLKWHTWGKARQVNLQAILKASAGDDARHMDMHSCAILPAREPCSSDPPGCQCAAAGCVTQRRRTVHLTLPSGSVGCMDCPRDPSTYE